jgi:hypothetical protein
MTLTHSTAGGRTALADWQIELDEVIGHLGAALMQSVSTDDRIIMDHVNSAHEISKIVRRKAQPTSSDDLFKIIDGMVLVCGRTGDALCDFEEQAAAFHAETGWMRPGKDMPMEGGGEDNREARRLKYNAWVQTKIEAGRAALKTAGGRE